MAISWTNIVVELTIPAWPHPLPSHASADRPIVLLAPELTSQVLGHLGNANIEQGGLLLGRLWLTEPSAASLSANTADLIELCMSIPALAAEGTSLSLTMEAAVWEAARTVCSSDESGSASPLRVVGWYHSHPHLGAFFSHTDRQTQAAFFANAFSVGWVIDPLHSTDAASLDEAFFLGPESAPITVVRQQMNEPNSTSKLI